MFSERNDPLDKPSQDQQDDGLLNGKECSHCGLWFRMDQAKLVPGKNAIRCPFCDWMFEDGKD